MFCECGCGQRARLHNDRTGEFFKFRRFVLNHYARTIPRGEHYNGYGATVISFGRRVEQHRARAERALGRPLPGTVEVHHADGSRLPDAPLVICQDAGYHKLLHRRMRVRDAGGNPNTDKICPKCDAVKHCDDFPKNRRSGDGLHSRCKRCAAAETLAAKRKKRAVAVQ